MGWEEAAARETVFASSSGHRVLGEYPWLNWLRRETDISRLFAFVHGGTGNVVLAVWLWAPGEESVPVAGEIWTLSESPVKAWPFDVHPRVMVDVIKGRGRKVSDTIRDREERKRKAMHDNEAYQQDMARVYRRRGKEGLARAIEAGGIPHPDNVDPEITGYFSDQLEAMSRTIS